MNVTQKTGLAIGAAVVAAAAALGVGYVATTTAAGTDSSQRGQGGRHDARPSGMPRSAMDTQALVTALAKGLDKDEASVKEAVESAMDSLRTKGDDTRGQPSAAPSGNTDPGSGTPPTTTGPQGGKGAAAKLAAAIATALGVDEATVLTIVQANLSTGRTAPSAAPSASPSTTPSATR
jgi:hypothetical protein